MAYERNHLDVVKYLIENGANIHAYDDGVLCYAIRRFDFELVKYLIDHGANIHAGLASLRPDIVGNHDYALKHSAINGYLNIVEYIIKNIKVMQPKYIHLFNIGKNRYHYNNS
jgi:ankyrin repeat protein